MLEVLYLVIGLMIVMAAIPVLTTFALGLAIVKRFAMRFNDPVERERFRVRLGGNVAYFVAMLNALAVLYYFVAAGLPLGQRFDPWLEAAAGRLPEGWYLGTAVAFLFAGFLLKITRSLYAALFLLFLFAVQIAIELWPTLFELARDPGLFARFFSEIARIHQANARVGGIPGTVMTTILGALVYGVALQMTYYLLALISFAIAMTGSLRLRRLSAHRFVPHGA